MLSDGVALFARFGSFWTFGASNAAASVVSFFFNHLALDLSDCLLLCSLTKFSSSVKRPWVMLSPSTVKKGMIVGLILAHCLGVRRAYRASFLSSFGRFPPARHIVMSSRR